MITATLCGDAPVDATIAIGWAATCAGKIAPAIPILRPRRRMLGRSRECYGSGWRAWPPPFGERRRQLTSREDPSRLLPPVCSSPDDVGASKRPRPPSRRPENRRRPTPHRSPGTPARGTMNPCTTPIRSMRSLTDGPIGSGGRRTPAHRPTQRRVILTRPGANGPGNDPRGD